MIQSTSHQITFAYQEIAELSDYMLLMGKSIENLLTNCSYGASAHGVTVSFHNKDLRQKVWDLTVKANDHFNEDTEEHY